MPTSKRKVRAILREILENQIAANDPPEVEETFTRLRRDGLTDDAAWRLLSAVLLVELETIVREQREFDRARYVRHLSGLPALPWELPGPTSGAGGAGA